MTRSFVRLVASDRETVSCELSHEDSPGHFTIFGTMKYNRITADLSIKWCFECPLALGVRIKESFRFLRLISSI